MAQYTRFQTYIEPFVKTQKTQAYSMMILSLASIIFFGVFAIRPTLLTIISLNKQIGQANDIDKQLSDKIRSLDQAQQILDRLSQQQSLLTDAIPDNPNVSSVLKMLELRAAAAQVTLGSVQFHAIALSGAEDRAIAATSSSTLAAETAVIPTPLSQSQTSSSPAVNPASPQKILLTFSATGQDSALTDFLHQLTLPRRLLVVSGITLSTKDKTANVHTLEAQAEVYQEGSSQAAAKSQ